MKNSAQTRLRLFGLGEQVAQATPNESQNRPKSKANTSQPTTTTPSEITFGSKEYAEVWQGVIEAIGDGSFFAGKITTQHSSFSSTLTATLIIHRTPQSNQKVGPICKIVPVWWELATHSTSTDTPIELPNDFSFKELLEKMEN